MTLLDSRLYSFLLKVAELLANKTLKFQRYYKQKATIFLPRKYEEKFPHLFSAKNTSPLDFMHTSILNKSLSNDFHKLTML